MLDGGQHRWLDISLKTDVAPENRTGLYSEADTVAAVQTHRTISKPIFGLAIRLARFNMTVSKSGPAIGEVPRICACFPVLFSLLSS